MRKFDTKVQHLKYKVLREVARAAWQDKLLETIPDIPKIIVPGKIPTMRCCVYKERAIVVERVKIAMGGNKENPNVIEVIDIACDECPMGGYEVTNSCRGCLAHRCEDVCKFGAISFDQHHVAHIDKTKCKECGACSKVCPYSAIRNYRRPCEQACKIKAISMGPDMEATIDNNKCISCGACVYQCPFGAITDKSFILDVIKYIKESENNQKYKVYAVVAPTIASQFTYAKLGQVVTGLKLLGFDTVTEAALGADMVAAAESKELAEKGFLTSSCCPAFVSYVQKNFPVLTPFVSHNLSPMATIGKYIKEHSDSPCKVVFIGPCTAKRQRFKRTKSSLTSTWQSLLKNCRLCLTAEISTSPRSRKANWTTRRISAEYSPAAAVCRTQWQKALRNKVWRISPSNPAPATASRNARSRFSKRAKAFWTQTSSKVWLASEAA